MRRCDGAAHSIATARGPAGRPAPNSPKAATSTRPFPPQALPWRPRLDLDGRTRYTLGGEGGRISAYDEAWAVTPSEALWMLIKPSSE